MDAITVRDLSKRFGPFKAVDGVSFTVRRGEIFGFLGANGAGKSTTIRMLCGLLEPSSGSAVVAGHDVRREPDRVKERIGYLSQRFSLYEDLTVAENLRFFGGIYGLANQRLAERSAWAVAMAGLDGREGTLARDLAGGWRQRLALGFALLHEPEILFLDEPTGGVDPVSRRAFWTLIQSLARAGTTVFVTTHFLDEAEYCQTVTLIHAGRLVDSGSPRQLKEEHLRTPILEIECDRVVEAMRLLQAQEWVEETTVFGPLLHAAVPDEAAVRSRLPGLLAKHGITLRRVERILPSLEDVFIHLIERKNRETREERREA
jgi:ABC-2 type transport system ATP-binding protein